MRFPFCFFHISPDFATATRSRAPLVFLKTSLQTSKMEDKSTKFDCGQSNVRHKFLLKSIHWTEKKISEQGKFTTVTSLKKRHRLRRSSDLVIEFREKDFSDAKRIVGFLMEFQE
jgi:hypothetical protein